MTGPQSQGTALVTGASTGIGEVYADRLAKRGYDLILVARDRQRLETLAARLRTEAKVTVEVLPADLTIKPQLLEVERRLGTDPSITLFVNNAGIGVPNGLVGADLDRLERMTQLNVTAVARLAAVAATAFAERESGTIVNIASSVALMPELSAGAYSATKAFALVLTQSMHAELARRGIRVQAVLPGGTRTEFWERADLDLGRLPPAAVMEVEELVDAALAGLDQGELVTIPPLPNLADWEAFETAREHLRPNLSRDHAAERYRRRN